MADKKDKFVEARNLVQSNRHQNYDPILYQRGVESDAFYLILSGRVMVQSGNEGFMIT